MAVRSLQGIGDLSVNFTNHFLVSARWCRAHGVSYAINQLEAGIVWPTEVISISVQVNISSRQSHMDILDHASSHPSGAVQKALQSVASLATQTAPGRGITLGLIGPWSIKPSVCMDASNCLASGLAPTISQQSRRRDGVSSHRDVVTREFAVWAVVGRVGRQQALRL